MAIEKKNYSLEDKFIASFALLELANIIDHEIFYNLFKTNTQNRSVYSINYVNEMLYYFINFGGINGFNISDITIPFNTKMAIETAKNILLSNDFNDTVKSYNSVVESLHKDNDKHKKFIFDAHTLLTLHSLQSLNKKNNVYDSLSIGYLASVRTHSFGLAYRNNIDLLIEKTINNSMITNTSPLGFLGGLTVALFSMFATSNIDIHLWPSKMIEIIESDKVKNFIGNSDEEESDYGEYIMYWKKYIDLRFSGDMVIKIKTNTNLVLRCKFYYDNFVTDPKTNFSLGFASYSSIIVAYDALLDCDGIWEKLIIYAVMNLGNGTSGTIAGALYGLVYGFGDAPNNMINYLENKKELYDVSKKLFIFSQKLH